MIILYMDYKDKYIKYKIKYLKLKNKNINNQTGGGKYIKKILYENNNFLIENNIDDDKLDIYSTFLIGSITKIFTVYIILILHCIYWIVIKIMIRKHVKKRQTMVGVCYVIIF